MSAVVISGLTAIPVPIHAAREYFAGSLSISKVVCIIKSQESLRYADSLIELNPYEPAVVFEVCLASMLSSILRSLRGSNLEVLKVIPTCHSTTALIHAYPFAVRHVSGISDRLDVLLWHESGRAIQCPGLLAYAGAKP